MTTLLYAVQKKDIEIVKHLLLKVTKLHAGNLTPLMLAVKLHHSECIPLLLNKYKNQHLTNSYEGFPKGSTAL